jgi:hypothetical protein
MPTRPLDEEPTDTDNAGSNKDNGERNSYPENWNQTPCCLKQPQLRPGNLADASRDMGLATAMSQKSQRLRREFHQKVDHERHLLSQVSIHDQPLSQSETRASPSKGQGTLTVTQKRRRESLLGYGST